MKTGRRRHHARQLLGSQTPLQPIRRQGAGADGVSGNLQMAVHKRSLCPIAARSCRKDERILNRIPRPFRQQRADHRLLSRPERCTPATPHNLPRMTVTKLPADCQTKEDVRAEIDRIDQALLTLLAERHRYVTRMAEIKTDPHEAHDPTRIEAVIAKQRKRAEELELDEDQAELIWRTLIDWNVNYEKGIIAARKHRG